MAMIQGSDSQVRTGGERKQVAMRARVLVTGRLSRCAGGGRTRRVRRLLVIFTRYPSEQTSERSPAREDEQYSPPDPNQQVGGFLSLVSSL